MQGATLDVRPHLVAARAGILGGCHLLFTRLIPLGTASPQAHPLWQEAGQVRRTPALPIPLGTASPRRTSSLIQPAR